MKNKKITRRLKRKLRLKAKFRAHKTRLRLSVFRSNHYIYAQIIDDIRGTTLVQVNEREIKNSSKTNLKKIDKAKLVGRLLAEKALKLKIKKVFLDRNGYRYHGRVKALTEGTREGGVIV